MYKITNFSQELAEQSKECFKVHICLPWLVSAWGRGSAEAPEELDGPEGALTTRKVSEAAPNERGRFLGAHATHLERFKTSPQRNATTRASTRPSSNSGRRGGRALLRK